MNQTNIAKYQTWTIKNPFFLTNIKELRQNLFESPKHTFNNNKKNVFQNIPQKEEIFYSFTQQIIKHFLNFFSKKQAVMNEFIEISTIFFNCEKFIVETLPNLQKVEIIFKYLPFFIRFLYFIEVFHSNLTLKNKDLVLIECYDENILFPILEISEFLDDLIVIFSQNLKRLSSFLVKYPEEKAIFLRIYSFLSFMKTMNFVENLETSLEKFSNEKLEKKAREMAVKLNERVNLDISNTNINVNEEPLQISQENYKRNASVNITKLAKDAKLKSISNLGEKDKQPSENFFKFLEEEPEIITNKPVIPEENRRSSCKIIENSGVTRNLGDISGFQSYISTKPANSLLLVSENHSRTSLINTSKLKDSENLPMNSVLNQVFPSVRYYKVNYEKQEKNDDLNQNIMNEEGGEYEKINRKVTEIREPIFKKTSFVKNSNCSKEECEKLNEKLTENLMNEIMLEEKNSLLTEKKKETVENRNSKINKKTIVNRPNREFSTFLDTLEKSKENLETLQKIPSKNDFFDEKNNEKAKNLNENERKLSKKKNSKPKIGITEDDFIKINSKTQINEKLIHASFKEKKDDSSAFDEDLMLSSVTSVGVSKEKPDYSKENNNRKPNNLFLGNFKDEKKSNYFKYEKKVAQDIDKSFDIYKTMNEESSKEMGKSIITKKKSQSINTKKN